MVLFLVFDVSDDVVQLAVGIGKRTEAFLPAEILFRPIFIVDEARRISLDFLHQFGDAHLAVHPHQNVDVVGHRKDGKRLVIETGDDTRDVAVHQVAVWRRDEVFAVFGGEDELVVGLNMGGGHCFKIKD